MIDPIFSHTFSSLVFSGSITKDKKNWAFGLLNGDVEFFTENVENSLLLHPCIGSARAVEFDPTDRFMAVGDSHGGITIIDLTTQETPFVQKTAHDHSIETIKYLSSNILLSGDTDGTVKVWDVRTIKSIQRFKPVHDFVADIAPVDDRLFVVATGNGLGSLYNINRPKRIQYYQQEDDDFSTCCYDNYCQMAVFASSRPKVYSVRVPSFDFVNGCATLTKRPIVLVRALGNTKCRILIVHDDGVVLISDLSPNRQIYSFRADDKGLNGGAAVGTRLLTWNSNCEAKMWNLDTFQTCDPITGKSEASKKKKNKKKRVLIHTKHDSFFDELVSHDDDE